MEYFNHSLKSDHHIVLEMGFRQMISNLHLSRKHARIEWKRLWSARVVWRIVEILCVATVHENVFLHTVTM